MSNTYVNNDVYFKNKAFIFIDNNVKEIKKAKKVLSTSWSDYFRGKKSFFHSVEGVEKIILKYGAQDCIIFCDKNMPDVEGDKYLIELREKWGEDITLVLHTGHPKPDSKKRLDAHNIYYKKKSDLDFILKQIKSKLTREEEEVSLEQMLFKPQSNQNDIIEKRKEKPIESANYRLNRMETKVNAFENIERVELKAIISDVNLQDNIVELQIQNPDDNSEVVYKKLPLSILEGDKNLVVNQVYKIVQTISKDNVNIEFNNTGKIEPQYKLPSEWDEKIQKSFDNIKTK